MAVAMLMEWNGVTKDEYEAITDALGLVENPPAGGLAHFASVTEDGLRVMDLWESQAAFEAFLGERLLPAVQEVGLDRDEPSVEFLEIHGAWVPNGGQVGALSTVG